MSKMWNHILISRFGDFLTVNWRYLAVVKYRSECVLIEESIGARKWRMATGLGLTGYGDSRAAGTAVVNYTPRALQRIDGFRT